MIKFCKQCGKEICRLSLICKSCSNTNRTGKFKWNTRSKIKIQNEGNSNWKGVKVGINALHAWVNRHKHKSSLCEKCKVKPPFDLANISQQYKRDLNDFQWLCRKCHMILDGRLERLNGGNKNAM